MAISPKQVVLRNVRIAFPELWEATAFKGDPNSKPRFSCTFLIEKGSDNDKAVQAAIVRVTDEKFKNTAQTIRNKIKGNSGVCCYIDGDDCTKPDGTVYTGFEGRMSLRTNRPGNNGAPKVVTGRNIPARQGEPGAPYSGCYVNAIVEPFAYANNPKSGVSCGLVLVQFAKDGESFGGGSTAADDALEAVESEESEDDLTF